MAALKPCSVAGCPVLVQTGRCPEHRRAADRSRGSASQRGYGTKWRATRRRYLRTNPVCSEADCLKLATDVDHIDGLGPNGPRGYDFDNLRGYCHSHHSQRTARDQPGGWHDVGWRS